MLGLFGKKPDHPMADIKSAQALLEDLPKNDALKSVMELTEWLESVADSSGFDLEHQFAVLRLLDETAQPYARKLMREYFAVHDLDKFHENRLWLVLGNLSRHTASAYCAVFDRYRQADKGGHALKTQLPLLAARAVHNMTRHVKYLCAHYCPVERAVWERLAQLYRHAEQHQYLDAPVMLYPGVTGNTSVKFEAGHLLGWYGCGLSSLSPLYIHLTERIVAQYRSAIDVHAQQSEHDLFSFDLSRPVAPMRVKVEGGARSAPPSGDGATSSMRFVSMDAMESRLEALILSLGRNVVPEDLDLGGSYEAETVRGAARYMLEYLNAPPLRRGVRRGVRVNLSVLNGFARVLEHTDVGLNFSEEPPMHWQAEDISSTGFHAVLPDQAGDAVRIGSLLGIQPDGVAHWGVAIVRRLMRDEANLLHAGAEMLASRIAGVVLRQSGGAPGEDGLAALWLHARTGESVGEARLLMKADTFSTQRSLQTQFNGKRYLLIPGGLLERGLDYDLARFRAIEEDTSSADA